MVALLRKPSLRLAGALSLAAAPIPAGRHGLEYGETANEDTQNSEFESNSFFNVEAAFVSAPYTFLVQRFHDFESKQALKEFLLRKLLRSGLPWLGEAELRSGRRSQLFVAARGLQLYMI